MQPAVADAPPKIHIRRPTKPVALLPAASQLQLPFAEQDDDFVEFAKSLTRLPAGKALSCAAAFQQVSVTQHDRTGAESVHEQQTGNEGLAFV